VTVKLLTVKLLTVALSIGKTILLYRVQNRRFNHNHTIESKSSVMIVAWPVTSVE